MLGLGQWEGGGFDEDGLMKGEDKLPLNFPLLDYDAAPLLQGEERREREMQVISTTGYKRKRYSQTSSRIVTPS